MLQINILKFMFLNMHANNKIYKLNKLNLNVKINMIKFKIFCIKIVFLVL